MKRKTLGYTLIEMMVAVGIVALIAAIGIPVALHMRNKSRLTKAVRDFQSRVVQARSLAAAGSPDSTWPAGSRVQSAGIRFISAQQYSVFIDRDLADGGEIDYKIVDFNVLERGTSIQFSAPNVFPSIIRMKPNGQLTSGAQQDVTIVDSTGQSAGNDSKTVRISLSGTPRIL